MKKIKLIALMLWIGLIAISCQTIQQDGRLFAVPVRPTLQWQEEGDRLSLSKTEAVLLANYFIEVDAYIKKTQ